MSIKHRVRTRVDPVVKADVPTSPRYGTPRPRRARSCAHAVTCTDIISSKACAPHSHALRQHIGSTCRVSYRPSLQNADRPPSSERRCSDAAWCRHHVASLLQGDRCGSPSRLYWVWRFCLALHPSAQVGLLRRESAQSGRPCAATSPTGASWQLHRFVHLPRRVDAPMCSGPQDHPSVVPIDLPTLTSLPQFGGDYRRSMLWGTYRPGLYFGT